MPLMSATAVLSAGLRAIYGLFVAIPLGLLAIHMLLVAIPPGLLAICLILLAIPLRDCRIKLLQKPKYKGI